MSANYFTNLTDEQLLNEYTLDKRAFDKDHPMNKAPLYADRSSAVQDCIIGKWYYENGGLFQYNKPLDWLFKADRLGDKEAAHYIGRIYYDTGSDSQCEYAYQWFKKSAVNSNPDSEYYLGEMYSKGKGVLKDVSAALVWYTKAALRGHLQAQLTTGLIYAETPNHRESAIKAYHWLSKAAETNNLDAVRALSKLKKNSNYDLADLVRKENPYPQTGKKVDTTSPKIKIQAPATLNVNNDTFKQPVQNGQVNIDMANLANILHTFRQKADNAPQELVQLHPQYNQSANMQNTNNKNTEPHTTTTTTTTTTAAVAYTQNTHKKSLDDISNGSAAQQQSNVYGKTNNNQDPASLESASYRKRVMKINGRSASEERSLEHDLDEMRAKVLASRGRNRNAMDVDSDSSKPKPKPKAQGQQESPADKIKSLRKQVDQKEETIKALKKKVTLMKRKIKKREKADDEGRLLAIRAEALNKLFYSLVTNRSTNMELE